jgi:beta-xylosidase
MGKCSGRWFELLAINCLVLAGCAAGGSSPAATGGSGSPNTGGTGAGSGGTFGSGGNVGAGGGSGPGGSGGLVSSSGGATGIGSGGVGVGGGSGAAGSGGGPGTGGRGGGSAGGAPGGGGGLGLGSGGRGASGGGAGVGTGGSSGTGGASAVLTPGLWGDQGNGTFKNPVLWADYNNLDVIAVGGDFYMIAASHHFMGMPVLHSKDMVNWSLISRIYRRLGLDPRYDTPGQAYQHGTWAPAIRYNAGRFWIYVTTPVEGLLMTSAIDAAGPWDPWTVVRAVADWEDPCPFWDDVDNAGGDGPGGRKAYLVRSQLRAGPIIIQEMSWDGKTLLGNPTTVATGPTLEGPKLHKRNGMYYIFAPEGGIDAGYQVVLRAAAILGPYTKRTILERGSTATNGPHQGSWIDLPSGQSWFYHFQQNQGWGRIAHLEPARWGADGWPAAGIDLDGNGIGEPVAQPMKPNLGGPGSVTGPTYPLGVPQTSDEFDTASLGLQWLWNHNPDDSKWSLATRPGWLRLGARALSPRGGTNGADGGSVPFAEDSIVFAYNTLVQLAMGKVCAAVAKLDTTGMIDGQRAGLTLFGQTYGWIGVVRANGQGGIRANINGTYTSGPALTGNTLFLRASINATSQISFAYSLDGVSFTALGGSLTVGRTWFEGIKFGLFSYNLSTGPAGGFADFDYFHYTHDGPH